MPSVTSWCAADAVVAHGEPTGRIVLTTAGSTQRIATFRMVSVATRRAATLMPDGSCTSMADGVLAMLRVVAMRPLASTRNPDPNDVGVQMVTTLSGDCRGELDLVDSRDAAGVSAALLASIATLST